MLPLAPLFFSSEKLNVWILTFLIISAVNLLSVHFAVVSALLSSSFFVQFDFFVVLKIIHYFFSLPLFLFLAFGFFKIWVQVFASHWKVLKYNWATTSHYRLVDLFWSCLHILCLLFSFKTFLSLAVKINIMIEILLFDSSCLILFSFLFLVINLFSFGSYF